MYFIKVQKRESIPSKKTDTANQKQWVVLEQVHV